MDISRAELQKIADMRIEEAKILLDKGKWSGAYYLAGYAVECGFKACIAKRTKKHSFPDKAFVNKCYVHDVEQLLGCTTILPLMDRAFELNWAIVKDWDEKSRY